MSDTTENSKPANFLPVFCVLAVVWIAILLFLPASKRYFTTGERAVCVIASLILLLSPFLLTTSRKFLVVLPFAAVIIFFTIGICRHPFYSLIDYLLYASSKEEKTAYLLLSESDAGAHFENGHISSIIFENPKVTGEQWGYLKSLPKLKRINFSNTNITDDDLEHLNGLIQPENVDLSTTQVTVSGIKNLQKSLPNTKIHR